MITATRSPFKRYRFHRYAWQASAYAAPHMKVYAYARTKRAAIRKLSEDLELKNVVRL